MAQPMIEATIRVNGESEPLAVATLDALLAEKAVDTMQRGIAVALNGAVVPRAAWRDTRAQAGRQRRDRARAARRLEHIRKMAPVFRKIMLKWRIKCPIR